MSWYTKKCSNESSTTGLSIDAESAVIFFSLWICEKGKMEKVVECSTPKVLSALERNDSGAEEIHFSETCGGRCIWNKLFKN